MSKPLPLRTAATLSDGSTVSGEARYVERAIAIDQDMQAVKRAWIDHLRAEGIKAAHPDDGWVDRTKDTVHLAYPQFNDGLAVGDRLALGHPDRYRVVEVIGSRPAGPITSAIWPAGVPYWWEFRNV